MLLREGCEVVAYDPAAMERAKDVFERQIRYAENAYEAAAKADALLILTDWEEFATLDLPRLHRLLRYPIVLDGRNLYQPEEMSAAGFMYYSVGRPDGYPKRAQVKASMEKAS
jgi:UDPglucose 6-dehydrogenase